MITPSFIYSVQSYFINKYNVICIQKNYIKNQKSNLNFTRLIPFRVSRVSSAHLRGFPPWPTLQGCCGGESLATCGRFDLLGI